MSRIPSTWFAVGVLIILADIARLRKDESDILIYSLLALAFTFGEISMAALKWNNKRLKAKLKKLREKINATQTR